MYDGRMARASRRWSWSMKESRESGSGPGFVWSVISYLIILPNNSARHLLEAIQYVREAQRVCLAVLVLCQRTHYQNFVNMSYSPTIYYGPVINPETLNSYKALPSCLFSVGPSGNIDWIVEDVAEHMLQDTLAQKGCIDVNVTTLRTGEFFVPGFIDTHTVRDIGHWHSGLLIYVD